MVSSIQGDVVSRGNKSPHKLFGVTSCFPGNQGFQEVLAEYHSLTANGQYYSSELHKPEKGHSVQSSVQISNNDLDLVHREENYSPSRAPSWPTGLTGRQGVQKGEG